jgi:hypothetical protein
MHGAYYKMTVRVIKELEKCIRLLAFPEGSLEHEAVERAAKQVLKELEEK